ncbi:family 16 glycosylhydrolase [Wenyingzhuangia sp. 2_MG-2023]|uniref:family 16 glycosylhydrolase n=1 Tax=Wenyingzhuangia sp. 2_MG-2023 TaxID=3062639 RepID=UPI0026E119D0|nr:family 16 glycosylhydrolase [Wenyingzhuangia sp. 2_MG-2023]MDO6738681.1 family 16 glycosylhydrolase [Wenyingzhuangia sp. 2_MG-2023]
MELKNYTANSIAKRLLLYSTMSFFTTTLLSCSKKESSDIETIATRIVTKSVSKTETFSTINGGGIVYVEQDNFTVAEKGLTWSETELPKIEENKEIATSAGNDFTLSVTHLKASTTYYVRAYARSSNNAVIYGSQKTITTDVDNTPTEPLSYLPSAGKGKIWTLQPDFTNEFNYADLTSTEFTNNWQNRFFNGWTGPQKLAATGDKSATNTSTIYSPEQASIVNGELTYKATIVGQDVKTGCISTKTKIGYPMYMEARVKISESSLATAVWMLSDDSSQEIDNLEAYGDKTHSYYSERLHLSHHTFDRSGGTISGDYQPSGQETYYYDNKGTQWADDYHDYGVLWLDPWTLKYYVDGELVRETPTNQIDPLNYTNGTGLNKDMYIIISAAAQPWRERQGITYLTDPSVLSATRSTSKFDWIRVYKPE